jgi:hypothetical protein
VTIFTHCAQHSHKHILNHRQTHHTRTLHYRWLLEARCLAGRRGAFMFEAVGGDRTIRALVFKVRVIGF